MLILFLWLQSCNSEILKLDVKWLIVSGLPILIALLLGGYIHKFKGFGIELEASLHNPIGRESLIATDIIQCIQGAEKGSLDHLTQSLFSRRNDYKRLSFILGKKDYYNDYVIEQYINRLPHLKYIEIKRHNGRFICLLPVSSFKINNETDSDKIKLFIRAIEENRFTAIFQDEVITDRVREDDSLIKVLPKVRASKLGILPVISKQNILIGIITTQIVEKRIADEVLGTYKL